MSQCHLLITGAIYNFSCKEDDNLVYLALAKFYNNYQNIMIILFAVDGIFPAFVSLSVRNFM